MENTSVWKKITLGKNIKYLVLSQIYIPSELYAHPHIYLVDSMLNPLFSGTWEENECLKLCLSSIWILFKYGKKKMKLQIETLLINHIACVCTSGNWLSSFWSGKIQYSLWDFVYFLMFSEIYWTFMRYTDIIFEPIMWFFSSLVFWMSYPVPLR